MLLILSASSARSAQIAHEIHIAQNARKIILPLRIDEAQPDGALRYLLAGLQRIDGFSASRSATIENLIVQIRRNLAELEPRSLSAPPRAAALANNLPWARNAFVGRTAECVALQELAISRRLVTIVGPGGVGKTRTAIEVARSLQQNYLDGVWLVELGSISDESLVPGRVAQSIGVAIGTSGDAVSILVDALVAKNTLLILDNCEHLLDICATIASRMLDSCPRVTILASSRARLGIQGETAYRLPSLSTIEARSLFIERARAANFGFTLSQADESTLAEVCGHLDGLPLAIELAASRTATLSVNQLRAMLNERFKLLSSGPRAEHQTLHATIDWSYNLLDGRDKELFGRLEVFAAAFTLEAAAAVCYERKRDVFEVLDILGSLESKSLVVVEAGGAESRYRLLESLRAYAREKAVRSEEYGALHERHLAYVGERFEAAGADYESTLQIKAIAEIAYLLEDARAAIEFALSSQRSIVAAKIFLSTRLWDYLGLHREVVDVVRRFVDALGDEPEYVGRVYERAALAFIRTGSYVDGHAAAERAVANARRGASKSVLADCLARYGDSLARLRRIDAAVQALDEAESTSPPTTRRELQILDSRAFISCLAGDLEAASSMYEKSRGLFRSMHNTLGEVMAATNLAEVDHERGMTDRAIANVDQVLAKAEALPDGAPLAYLLRNKSAYLGAVGQPDAAIATGRRALEYYGSTIPKVFLRRSP